MSDLPLNTNPTESLPIIKNTVSDFSEEGQKEYDPFERHWNKKKIHKADDIEESHEYYMKNPELKYEYFKPDFISAEPKGIEIQIPYGKEAKSWYKRNDYIPIEKDIMKQHQNKKIKWDDQRFFVRLKKKVRQDVDFSTLLDKNVLFLSTNGGQNLIAKVEAIDRKPRRATGFLFLKDVLTYKQ